MSFNCLLATRPQSSGNCLTRDFDDLFNAVHETIYRGADPQREPRPAVDRGNTDGNHAGSFDNAIGGKGVTDRPYFLDSRFDIVAIVPLAICASLAVDANNYSVDELIIFLCQEDEAGTRL